MGMYVGEVGPVMVGMVWICIKLVKHIVNSRLVMG